MCNMAGYVGTEAAAPILLKMIREEEGFWGGFYTGIATIHEGKIYYAKLTGDTKRLLENTDAASLPGNIGLIHSRSRSGGGDEWAHPFIGKRAGKAEIAYVANGSAGYFLPNREAENRIADALLADGYEMMSRIVMEQGEKQRYNALSDGTTAHMSDVMCQLILSRMDQGKNPVDAMTDAYCTMPGEIVGLLVSLSQPDAITYSRVNQSMYLGFAPHGAYLATAPSAIPADAGEVQLLPACSSGQIFRDRFTAVPYPVPPAKVAPLHARVWQEAYTVIQEELAQGVKTVKELSEKIKPLFDEADCVPYAPLVYGVLNSMYRAGKICFEERRVPGAFDWLDAPRFVSRLL